MTEKNTSDKKFTPLPAAKEFAEWNSEAQDSRIRERMNLIKNTSTNNFQKAANYFFLLKSKKPTFFQDLGWETHRYTHPVIENAVSLAGQVSDGHELNLMNSVGNKNIIKAIFTLESILNNITNVDGIEKKIFSDFEKIIHNFFQKNPIRLKNISEDVNIKKSSVEKNSEKAENLIKRLDEKQKRAEQATEKIELKTQESLKNFEQKTQEYLKDLQQQANLNIFANEAEIFEKTANDYRERGIFFLISAGVSLFLLFSTALYLLETHYKIDEISVGGTLLSILSLTALGICMRAYFVSSHNEAHNRHRSNVLRSYKNIYENTAETERKEVVTQTLSAAFQQLPTGFSKQQSDSGGVDLSSLVSLFKSK